MMITTKYVEYDSAKLIYLDYPSINGVTRKKYVEKILILV